MLWSGGRRFCTMWTQRKPSFCSGQFPLASSFLAATCRWWCGLSLAARLHTHNRRRYPHSRHTLAGSRPTATDARQAVRAAASTTSLPPRLRRGWAASTTSTSQAPACTSTRRLRHWRRCAVADGRGFVVDTLSSSAAPTESARVPPSRLSSVKRCSLLPPPPIPPSRPQELGQTAYGNPHSVTPSSVRASREVEAVRRSLMALFGADPKEYEVRAVRLRSALGLSALAVSATTSTQRSTRCALCDLFSLLPLYFRFVVFAVSAST